MPQPRGDDVLILFPMILLIEQVAHAKRRCRADIPREPYGAFIAPRSFARHGIEQFRPAGIHRQRQFTFALDQGLTQQANDLPALRRAAGLAIGGA